MTYLRNVARWMGTRRKLPKSMPGKEVLCLSALMANRLVFASSLPGNLCYYSAACPLSPKLQSSCCSQLSTSNIVNVAQYWVLFQQRTSGSYTSYTGNETHFPSFPHLIHNGSYGLRSTAVYSAPHLLQYNESSLLRQGEGKGSF